MDRYVITASSGTRSQWRLMSAGIMCSDCRILKIIDEPQRSDRLETLDKVSRESKQDAVAVIQSRKNECHNERLEH